MGSSGLTLPLRASASNTAWTPRLRLLGFAALFLAAIVPAAWQALHLPGAAFGPYTETTAVARSLAAGRGFADPFTSLPTGATAHLAPLFPLLLAALISIFGNTPAYVLAAEFLCVFMHALHTVLLVPLSRVLFGNVTAGIWAALFYVLAPTIRVFPQWEAIYAATGVMLFCLATVRICRSGRRPVLQGAAAGALCGLLLLLNPALLIVCAAWMAYLLFARRPVLRARAVLILSFAAAAGLVCLPWTIRNYRQFGVFIPLRDNLGIELYVSNSDCAAATDAQNSRNGCHALLHPNHNVSEAMALRDMGEVRYNQSRLAAAIGWMRRHPERFAGLTLDRAREFWLPTPTDASRLFEYSLWIVTGFSLVGLVVMIRERNRGVVFIVVSLALYPAIYYLIQSATRYRFPVVWISLLPAGLGMRVAAGWALGSVASRLRAARP